MYSNALGHVRVVFRVCSSVECVRCAGGESDEGGSDADIAKGHSSSSGGEGSGADSEGRSSDGESDAEDVQKKDEEEIFGSSSGSDSDDA